MSTRTSIWIGRVLSGLVVAFLAFDAIIKILRLPMAVDGTTQLGYPERLVVPIGSIEMILLVMYLVPRLSVFGTVLWTGYLGGAVATHLRIGSPLLGFTLFPLYVAALLWGGLYLRDARVRNLLAPVGRSTSRQRYEERTEMKVTGDGHQWQPMSNPAAGQAPEQGGRR